MNIEKSRLISEAAPHLNASLGTINGNEFAAIVPVIPGHIGGRETNIVSAKALHKALAWEKTSLHGSLIASLNMTSPLGTITQSIKLFPQIWGKSRMARLTARLSSLEDPAKTIC